MDRDGLGALGYGCLATLLLGGGAGGLAAGFLGVAAVVRGARADVDSAAEARALFAGLEGALALCALGALLLLIACIAGVVLLKELGDDTARARRGAIGPGQGGAEGP